MMDEPTRICPEMVDSTNRNGEFIRTLGFHGSESTVRTAEFCNFMKDIVWTKLDVKPAKKVAMVLIKHWEILQKGQLVCEPQLGVSENSVHLNPMVNDRYPY